ncbi:precorrin-6y C5,15-methyltransferase (decarboxylating) subunit CbiE [Holophaga foetida]|uniref:precorrin-6y C5,15-methyltransferase (decarboxylating) subunit CbiE n=1 Tax=Holophaga foetida TaxID=35839 RepID=UPI0002471CF0|nr:precorrin-6y C5,15-methyltransferase (decarboxylating) subunit CbiE [Holophaga foetida]
MTAPLLIVGCGPGDPDLITPAARRAALEAEVLAGTPRLLELFPEAPGERLPYAGGLEPFLDALESRMGQKRISVLVTGDPGVASLAGTLRRRFGKDACRVIPGISSVQLAFSEVGLDWLDARILRAHGEVPEWDPAWAVHSGPFAILAGSDEAAAFAAKLAAHLDREAVWRCERLGLPGQRIDRMEPAALARAGCDSLSVLIVEGEVR